MTDEIEEQEELSTRDIIEAEVEKYEAEGEQKAEAEAEQPAKAEQPDEREPTADPVDEVAQEAHRLERAPQSWTPANREHWGTLPESVRQQIHKREQDVERTLSETAQERRLAKAYRDVVTPFAPMIQAEGSDPLRATQELFKTAYMLRTASGPQKAQLVAGLVHQFGVDIAALDAALAGGGQQYQQPLYQQQGEPPLTQEGLKRLLSEAKSRSEIEQFASSGEYEFFNDVREDMADIIEVASRRGVHKTLKQAYTEAVRLNPDISRITQEREQARAAKEAQERAKKARRASSSVTGSPAGSPPVNEGELSRRDAILNAMEQVGG